MSLKTKNMFLCSYVFKTKTCPYVLMSLKQKHVLMFLCLKTKNMSSYPYVLKQKTCSYVFKTKTCPYVLMS